MKTKIYTIYDSVAKESGPLMYSKNRAVALRQFEMALSGNSRINDYKLFELGEFDTERMKIQPCEPFEIISIQDVEEED